MVDARVSDLNSRRRGTGRLGRLVLLLAVMFMVAGCGTGGDDPAGGEAKPGDAGEVQTVELQIKDEMFQLELALDEDSRAQGLSDRQSLADDGGMLFVFESSRETEFVMRRCYFPIDLIYVYEDGRIDSLHEMQVIKPVGGSAWKNPSSGYYSNGKVKYVIELKGGTMERLGLVRGDKIVLPEAVLQLRPR